MHQIRIKMQVRNQQNHQTNKAARDVAVNSA